MKYRIDKYNNELSILGFGCMRFPKKFEESEKLILYAIEQGINYFDTAYIYGDSEKTLGRILKKNNIREKIYIATKLPLIITRKKSDFDKYFNMQLKRLDTDYIDYYMMHMITDMDQWQKFCDMGIKQWIKDKKKEGKIRQIGFSFHGSQSEFLKIIDASDWDFCLIQYNYMNENYQAGKVGLRKAYEKGIAVKIMEPLLGGRLANLPKKAKEILKKENKDMSEAQWALKWIWNQKEPVTVLSGMSNINELKDNIDATKNTDFGKKEIDTIEKVKEIFNESYKIPCTGCNYCMPCPKNVNIPAAFLSYNAYYAMGKIEGLKQYVMSISITSRRKISISNCTECGICEKKCPQNIEIIKELKRAKKKIEPFWVKSILKLVKSFVNRKK